MAGQVARGGRSGVVRAFRDGVALARVERAVIAAVWRGTAIPCGDGLAVDVDEIDPLPSLYCEADSCDAEAEHLDYITVTGEMRLTFALCGRHYAILCMAWGME